MSLTPFRNFANNVQFFLSIKQLTPIKNQKYSSDKIFSKNSFSQKEGYCLTDKSKQHDTTNNLEKSKCNNEKAPILV